MKVINISRNYLKENVISLANNNIREKIMNFGERMISFFECKKTVRKTGNDPAGNLSFEYLLCV